jgi:hypothetical protein
MALFGGLAHVALAIFSSLEITTSVSRAVGLQVIANPLYVVIMVLLPAIIGTVLLVRVRRSYIRNRTLGWPAEGNLTMFRAAGVTLGSATLLAGFLLYFLSYAP